MTSCFTIELAKANGLAAARHPLTETIRGNIKGARIERVGRQETVLAVIRPAGSLFFSALHAAFARHLPFALRPEVCMSLINFTLAETVKRHPEDYRTLFNAKPKWNDTRKAAPLAPKKTLIEVTHNALVRGDPRSPWHEVFPLFNEELRKVVPVGVMDHMLPAFSTATPETDAAQMAMFMDVVSPFYDYRVNTLCGIPAVRLLGAATDWEKLLHAAAALSEVFSKHLKPYFDGLLPVLRALVEQAVGAPPNQAFWKSIYKYENQSGGALFNGWSSCFVHYVDDGQGKLVERRDKRDWGAKYGGLASGSVPLMWGSVPFEWNCLGTPIPMAFLGGVMATEDRDGFLTPELSYAVLERS